MYNKHGPSPTTVQWNEMVVYPPTLPTPNHKSKVHLSGHDTRKMQNSESVSPPKEQGSGNPTLLTAENQAFSWRLMA